MPKYCECGRGIKVQIRSRWITPQDDHDMCRQCYQAQRDSRR